MERVLYGVLWKNLPFYLDDIIVIAPDFGTHLQRLEEVLCWLRKAGLNPAKCELLQKDFYKKFSKKERSKIFRLRSESVWSGHRLSNGSGYTGLAHPLRSKGTTSFYWEQEVL